MTLIWRRSAAGRLPWVIGDTIGIFWTSTSEHFGSSMRPILMLR
jgi:hypothetical protein